jgi:hypothetical protein
VKMQQMVKHYSSFGSRSRATRKFERDAKKLARDGWQVQSVSQTAGGTLITPRWAKVIVVYVKRQTQ